MSKGSKRRPGDSEKYRENWDRIFGEAHNDSFFVEVRKSKAYVEFNEKCRKDLDEAIKNAIRQGFSEELTADIGDNDPRRFVAAYGEEGLQSVVWEVRDEDIDDVIAKMEQNDGERQVFKIMNGGVGVIDNDATLAEWHKDPAYIAISETFEKIRDEAIKTALRQEYPDKLVGIDDITNHHKAQQIMHDENLFDKIKEDEICP